MLLAPRTPVHNSLGDTRHKHLGTPHCERPVTDRTEGPNALPGTPPAPTHITHGHHKNWPGWNHSHPALLLGLAEPPQLWSVLVAARRDLVGGDKPLCLPQTSKPPGFAVLPPR